MALSNAPLVRVGDLGDGSRLELLGVAHSLEYEHFFGNEMDFHVAKEGKRYLWLKIAPGGFLHKHTDRLGVRRHYVLSTNPKSILYLGDEQHHLDEGGIYDMDGRVIHWSVNNGDTDRIHRIDLFPNEPS